MNELDEHMPGFSTQKILTVKVPASSANLGPGFDSLGVALNLYMIMEAELSDRWQITSSSAHLQGLPEDDTNFIAQVAIKTARMYSQEMPPVRASVKSEIPLARGLGSSAAAIIAGIELANEFCGLALGKTDKLRIAAGIEGHPDNVGACLYGGFVVGSQIEGEVHLTVMDQIDFDPILVIPGEELLTKTSREVLPEKLDFSSAVRASAIANQLLAALLTKQWEIAGKMMASDEFHQPYRKKLVPFYSRVEEAALAAGAFGVALSGAGPSLLCLAEPGKGRRVTDLLLRDLEGMEVYSLEMDKQGCLTY